MMNLLHKNFVRLTSAVVKLLMVNETKGQSAVVKLVMVNETEGQSAVVKLVTVKIYLETSNFPCSQKWQNLF